MHPRRCTLPFLVARLGKLSSIGRRGFPSADIALAALVVLVVGLMIVPLPTPILDILIATNLSVAILILLVVLYMPDAMSIATFPTILLLTTLYRLSLSVASTRLILLQANAGVVIRAFGTFVVRGNYVVGAVVFLVLTLIQFIVIAKGGERVAEIGARFTLDALPGKQMAIDSELRAGSIDGNEARRRRRQLQRESQFYGAMDGAMKFVKGDVIASIVIVIVNILGGLAIGVGMKGMPVVDAIKRYGLLTIGDGLVTQIPALVLSMSAGILVTRVASEEADRPLGEELARQLFGSPKAIGSAATIVTLLGLVPGLPTLPFLFIGGALFSVAWVRRRQKAVEDARAATEPAPARARAGIKEPAFIPHVVGWSVNVSPDLQGLLDRGSTGPDGAPIGLRGMVSALREQVFAELGVPLPPPRLAVRANLPERNVVVSLFEVPTRHFELPGGTKDEDACAIVVAETLSVLRLRGADFITLAVTQKLLSELEQIAPATVINVVPKPLSVQLLRDVLRRLVDEQIGVRDLQSILEALATSAPTVKDPQILTEHVRSQQLNRVITFGLTKGQNDAHVILIDTLIEDTIRRAIVREPSTSYLALAPQAGREIIAAVTRTLREAPPDTPRVFLTTPDVRYFLRQTIRPDLPDAKVVSYADLLPHINIVPVAKVSVMPTRPQA
jgi:type III secretion protein V